jgi:hypothetical protein
LEKQMSASTLIAVQKEHWSNRYRYFEVDVN